MVQHGRSRTRRRGSARACASAATALGTWSPASRPTPPTRGTPGDIASRCSAPRRRPALPSSARPAPPAACSKLGLCCDCSRGPPPRAGAAAAQPWQGQDTRELGWCGLGGARGCWEPSYDKNAFSAAFAGLQHQMAPRAVQSAAAGRAPAQLGPRRARPAHSRGRKRRAQLATAPSRFPATAPSLAWRLTALGCRPPPTPSGCPRTRPKRGGASVREKQRSTRGVNTESDEPAACRRSNRRRRRSRRGTPARWRRSLAGRAAVSVGAWEAGRWEAGRDRSASASGTCPFPDARTD
jgi:hypothetical protein